MSTTLTRGITAVAIFTLMIFGMTGAEAQTAGRGFDVAQSPQCSTKCRYGGILCDGQCVCCWSTACPACILPDGPIDAGASQDIDQAATTSHQSITGAFLSSGFTNLSSIA